jgi:hypothetical protein
MLLKFLHRDGITRVDPSGQLSNFKSHHGTSPGLRQYWSSTSPAASRNETDTFRRSTNPGLQIHSAWSGRFLQVAFTGQKLSLQKSIMHWPLMQTSPAAALQIFPPHNAFGHGFSFWTSSPTLSWLFARYPPSAWTRSTTASKRAHALTGPALAAVITVVFKIMPSSTFLNINVI